MDPVDYELSENPDEEMSPPSLSPLREMVGENYAVNMQAALPKTTAKSGKQRKDVFVWKDALVYLLIERWQEEQVLFNIRDPNYHDKVKRANAVERIIMSMEENGHTPVPSKILTMMTEISRVLLLLTLNVSSFIRINLL